MDPASYLQQSGCYTYDACQTSLSALGRYQQQVRFVDILVNI